LSGGVRKLRTGILCLIVLLLSPRALLAEPTLRDLEEIYDPLIVEALSCDLGLQPPEKCDQKRAERLYLAYVERHPDSDVVPHIYRRLAETYGGWARRQDGAVKDYSKARSYFQKVMETWPEGKVGHDYLDAMVNVAALSPAKEEKVGKYIEYYRFLEHLEGLDRQKLSKMIWLSERQRRRQRTRSPDLRDELVEGLLRHVRRQKEIAAGNMAAAAAADQEKPFHLLSRIIEEFPDSEPGEYAREELRKLNDRMQARFSRSIEPPDLDAPDLEAELDDAPEGQAEPPTAADRGVAESSDDSSTPPEGEGRTGWPAAAVAALAVVVAVIAVAVSLRRRRADHKDGNTSED